MAKKRVEEGPEVNLDMDSLQQEVPMQEIPKHVAEEKKIETAVQSDKVEKPLFNCLRNEKVIVRFLPKPSAMVQNPRHVLYGGMSENATRSFVVPRLSTGQFKNILTDDEKAFLEKAMGLEINALSVYRKNDNFWDDSNPNGIGRVVLHKQDNYLDLSVPADYIKYKILLANKDQIACSMKELQDRPKATFQFVIIEENTESQDAVSRVDIKKKCYMEYGKVEDDANTLRTLLELLEGRPLAPRTKIDFIKSSIDNHIQNNPRVFLSTIQDPLLPLKVLIKRGVDKGLIGMKNDTYYLREDNSPLCEMGEESTLNNAAKYLGDIKRQTLKYTLEAELKK